MSLLGFRKTKIKLFQLSRRRLLVEKYASRFVTNHSLIWRLLESRSLPKSKPKHLIVF